MIIVKKYDVKFEGQVLDLLRPLWGHMLPEQGASYFKWKYIDNPCTDDILYFTAIDEPKQKVVGVLGFLILQYNLNGKTINLATISDGVIHADYRRMGIYEKLIRYGMNFIRENHDVFFCNATSGNYPANQGLIKMGSIPIAQKKIYYKSSLYPYYRHKHDDYAFSCATEARPGEMAALCKKKQNNAVLSLNKTSEFLSWRYSNPLPQYGYVYAYKGNDLVAFVSYYKISDHRHFILDYEYCEKDIFRSLIKFLMKHENCRLLQLWTISKNEAEMKFLHSLGFRPYIKLMKLLKKERSSPVLVRPCIPEYTEKDFYIDGIDMRNEFNWEFNLICSDGI